MFSSVIAAVLSRPRDGAFAEYYSGLMVDDPQVAPTAREAQEDYLVRLQAQVSLNNILM